MWHKQDVTLDKFFFKLNLTDLNHEFFAITRLKKTMGPTIDSEPEEE